MKKALFNWVLAVAASTAFLALPITASAEDNPKEIRIGISSAGVGGKPKVGYSSVTTAHLRGVLEDEFKKDGIKVVWRLFPGAGPATNEAFSNNQVDFGWHGDLPAIIGRSTGLKHKVIFAAGRFGPLYFVVPADSQAKSLADLKGKTISTFKGTALQLQQSRLFKKYGLKESDFRVISQDQFSSRTSLSTGDIDGTITSPWTLEARGVAKRILEIRDDKTLVAPLTFWVGEEFEKKYPHIVQRVTTALIKQAHWNSLEENREAQYKLWAQSGVPYLDWKKDWEGYDLKERHSPLLDENYIASMKQSAAEAKEFKLIRKDVDVDSWLEPKYLNTALKELNLEGFWPELDAQGNRKDGKK
ncbi:MAG: TetR family transcriptional regulator [Betaproteobacteria bacterium HGW-Betaproteobacteria-22]|nr:MAG: TetR family transcriptional regulator [Betaproteobacteria bacterium HGW-Betaproteobacteria-22]